MIQTKDNGYNWDADMESAFWFDSTTSNVHFHLAIGPPFHDDPKWMMGATSHPPHLSLLSSSSSFWYIFSLNCKQATNCQTSFIHFYSTHTHTHTRMHTCTWLVVIKTQMVLHFGLSTILSFFCFLLFCLDILTECGPTF